MTRTSSRSNFQRLLSALLLVFFVVSALILSALPLRADAATVIFVTTTSASNQTWSVPADWTNTNTIEVIGGGGGGGYKPHKQRYAYSKWHGDLSDRLWRRRWLCWRRYVAVQYGKCADSDQ